MMYFDERAVSMWSNINVKPVKFFEKMTKDQNIYLFGGPKIEPLRPILYTSLKVAPVSI